MGCSEQGVLHLGPSSLASEPPILTVLPGTLVSTCSPSSFLISALLPQILPPPQLPFCLPHLFPFSHLLPLYLPSPTFSLTFSPSLPHLPHLFLTSCPFCLSPSPPPSVSLSFPSLLHPPISPFLSGVWTPWIYGTVSIRKEEVNKLGRQNHLFLFKIHLVGVSFPREKWGSLPFSLKNFLKN